MREETRTGLPGDMKPGERYENVAVGRRLMGRVDARAVELGPMKEEGSSVAGSPTKKELYNQAKRLNIEGRSSMTKAQLERAISRKRS